MQGLTSATWRSLKGFAVTVDATYMKVMKIATAMQIPPPPVFMQTGAVSKRVMEEMDCQTTICQEWPGDFKDKLAAFQRCVMKLPKGHGADISQRLFWHFRLFWDAKGTRSRWSRKTTGKTSGYKEHLIALVLCVAADAQRLPSYIVLKREKKKTPKNEHFSQDVIVRVQEKDARPSPQTWNLGRDNACSV